MQKCPVLLYITSENLIEELPRISILICDIVWKYGWQNWFADPLNYFIAAVYALLSVCQYIGFIEALLAFFWNNERRPIRFVPFHTSKYIYGYDVAIITLSTKS